MDFLEDLLEGNKRRGHNSHNDRYDNRNHSRDDHGEHAYRDPRGHEEEHSSMESFRPMVEKVLKNKPILFGLILGAFLLAILAIVLLIACMPIINQAFGFVDKNGVKGIFDMLLPIVDRLWKGQG